MKKIIKTMIILLCILFLQKNTLARESCNLSFNISDLEQKKDWWEDLYHFEKSHRNCVNQLRTAQSANLVTTILADRAKEFKNVALVMKHDFIFKNFILMNLNSNGDMRKLLQLEAFLKKPCSKDIAAICQETQKQIQINLNQTDDTDF